MKYYYIYKITCTTGELKDKFYFGKRITSIFPENDKYKGSGILLKRYYKEHSNNYIKEIISFHNSKNELNKAEYDIIHPWLGNENCLNLCEGGHGGSRLVTSEETKKKQSEAHKGKKQSYLHRLHNKMSHIGQRAWNKGLSLRPLSDECKEKISNKIRNRKWMNKNGEDKRIPIDEINIYINKGYKLGRVHLQRK